MRRGPPGVYLVGGTCGDILAVVWRGGNMNFYSTVQCLRSPTMHCGIPRFMPSPSTRSPLRLSSYLTSMPLYVSQATSPPCRAPELLGAEQILIAASAQTAKRNASRIVGALRDGWLHALFFQLAIPAGLLIDSLRET